jgi:hypothetical protein
MVQFDPDTWKTFVHERLTSAPGNRGYLSLFGRSATEHEMFSEHCAAEASDPVTIRGTTFDKWVVKPHRPDNHYLDTLVGNCVAASVQGILFDAGAASGDKPPERKIIRMNEEREAAMAAQAARGATGKVTKL